MTDLTVRATTNVWDAPVGIYHYRNGRMEVRRDGAEPIVWLSREFYPHAVILVDGVLSAFDQDRQPADFAGSTQEDQTA
jgi:hypothetical protein